MIELHKTILLVIFSISTLVSIVGFLIDKQRTQPKYEEDNAALALAIISMFFLLVTGFAA